MSDRCETCNTPWADHLGLAGTCAEVARLRAALHEVMMFESVKPNGSHDHRHENERRRRIAIEALQHGRGK